MLHCRPKPGILSRLPAELEITGSVEVTDCSTSMFISGPLPNEQPLCHAVLASLTVNGKMSAQGNKLNFTITFPNVLFQKISIPLPPTEGFSDLRSPIHMDLCKLQTFLWLLRPLSPSEFPVTFHDMGTDLFFATAHWLPIIKN